MNWSMTLRLFTSLIRQCAIAECRRCCCPGRFENCDWPSSSDFRIAGLVQRGGAVLRRHQALDLKLLLGGKREELVGRLDDLQIADRSLRGIGQSR